MSNIAVVHYRNIRNTRSWHIDLYFVLSGLDYGQSLFSGEVRCTGQKGSKNRDVLAPHSYMEYPQYHSKRISREALTLIFSLIILLARRTYAKRRDYSLSASGLQPCSCFMLLKEKIRKKKWILYHELLINLFGIMFDLSGHFKYFFIFEVTLVQFEPNLFRNLFSPQTVLLESLVGSAFSRSATQVTIS